MIATSKKKSLFNLTVNKRIENDFVEFPVDYIVGKCYITYLDKFKFCWEDDTCTDDIDVEVPIKIKGVKLRFFTTLNITIERFDCKYVEGKPEYCYNSTIEIKRIELNDENDMNTFDVLPEKDIIEKLKLLINE